MSTPTKDRPTAADWLARAAALEPRNEAFIDGLKTTWFDLSGK